IGGGGGIGRVVAAAFSREGARLALSGRSLERLEETRSQCAEPEGVLLAPGDVSRPDDVTRVVGHVEGALGGIDVLINAAGVHGAIGPVYGCDPEQWKAALEVNLYGCFLLSRAVVPNMVARKSGRIILFSGGGATSPMPRFSAYAASKAGVVRFVETIADELRPHVQVNAIAPGIV